jgi:hypothetical protein
LTKNTLIISKYFFYIKKIDTRLSAGRNKIVVCTMLLIGKES